MNIEKALFVLGAAAGQHGAGVGFVRALVLRKPDVAVEPKERAFSVAPERQLGLGEGGGQILDEIAERRLDVPLIGRAIVLEPFLALMKCEGFEEGQGVRAEAGKGHRKTHLKKERWPSVTNAAQKVQ